MILPKNWTAPYVKEAEGKEPKGQTTYGHTATEPGHAAGQPRRRHSSEFKAHVAVEALKGQKTLNELASEFGVHPVQIAQWKRQLLYQEIGQLKVEVDWLRRKGIPRLPNNGR